jgi:WD40 repeat protein
MELIHEELAVQPPGGRVLYRCVDATNTLIAFGANTGSVYMHAASSLKLLIVVPVSSSDVSHVAFSPSGELFAASSGKHLYVVRHNAEHTRDTSVTLLSISQHEHPLSALAWDDSALRVFCGSEDGLVTSAKVPLVQYFVYVVVWMCGS